ncbi:MAG TPA: hypothetical protein VJH97_00810 [Candidatus Nanoarchaeia archaeon]|nr:hypothetical protein [Candidatus Nanoarchaeia archaeon]
MLNELQEHFNSMLKCLDVLYVLEGIKPAARILVEEDEKVYIEEYLSSIGLQHQYADFKVKKLDEGQYSDKGERLPGDQPGKSVMYIAKESLHAEKAKAYEQQEEHIKLGLALGYPRCCCEFFAKQAGMQEKRFNDYTLPGLAASRGFIFPFYLNYAARHFDISLLSHFPCSFNCPESMKIAKTNLEVIEKRSPEYAAIIRGMLKGAVIYTENYGVFLLRNAKMLNNKFHYDTVMGTQNNKFAEVLRSNNEIQAVDKNHIMLGNQTIKTPNIGFAYFI